MAVVQQRQFLLLLPFTLPLQLYRHHPRTLPTRRSASAEGAEVAAWAREVGGSARKVNLYLCRSNIIDAAITPALCGGNTP